MIEVRCPKCRRLLFKAMGQGTVIEIVCQRCGSRVRFPAQTAEIIEPAPPMPPAPTVEQNIVVQRVGPSELKTEKS